MLKNIRTFIQQTHTHINCVKSIRRKNENIFLFETLNLGDIINIYSYIRALIGLQYK